MELSPGAKLDDCPRFALLSRYPTVERHQDPLRKRFRAITLTIQRLDSCTILSYLVKRNHHQTLSKSQALSLVCPTRDKGQRRDKTIGPSSSRTISRRSKMAREQIKMRDSDTEMGAGVCCSDALTFALTEWVVLTEGERGVRTGASEATWAVLVGMTTNSHG